MNFYRVTIPLRHRGTSIDIEVPVRAVSFADARQQAREAAHQIFEHGLSLDTTRLGMACLAPGLSESSRVRFRTLSQQGGLRARYSSLPITEHRIPARSDASQETPSK